MAILKAGRDLDALVAEQVMGWKRHMADGERWIYQGLSWPTRTKLEQHGNYPAYSTDIAAAWTVMLKVRELTDSWILVAPDQKNERFYAYESTGCADPDFGSFCAYAPTAPEAICQAALTAMSKKTVDPS